MEENKYKYSLSYHKDCNGKYIVSPTGIYNSPPIKERILYKTNNEKQAKEYITVYELLNFIENQPNLNKNKNLKVYRMDYYEWWVSDKSEEETIDSYVEKYGEYNRRFVNIDDIEECSLENEGMFWDFENPYVNDLIKNILEGQNLRKAKIGDLEVTVSDINGYCVYIPFKKAIQLEEYTEPHMISCAEY